MSDEKFADCVDPSVVAILSKFSLAITAHHSIISNVVSELEGVKMLINDVQNSVNSLPPTSLDQSSFPPLSQPNFPQHSTGGASAMPGNASAMSGIAKYNSRKPLKQPPLGSTEPWNTVGTRKNRKSRISVAVSQSELESESETSPPSKPDPFDAAVKDAEKSILIHNLNLGQSPTLNPATISSKITAALLLCVAQLDPLAEGVVTAGVKDTIDDIIGMVKGMTLFGTCTRPNRNPLKSEDNGKFFTVPVKLTFANKQVAIRVTEVLKGTYKLPITTPYHKSLRACFTHVQKKVRALNPGYQVRVNLDAKNRLLKASVRPAEKCPWELLTETFPLPQQALDPKFQDLKSLILPSIGSPTKSPPPPAAHHRMAWTVGTLLPSKEKPPLQSRRLSQTKTQLATLGIPVRTLCQTGFQP